MLISKKKKITQILAEETGGKSYKTHKYSLDSERSTLGYNETEDHTFVWKKRGETEPPTTYKSLELLAKMLAARDEQVLTYFLDGSRHVYNALLSVEDLCEILMIGKNSAYTLLASGELKAYRAGTRWKIPREAVTQYVKKQAKL